MEPYDLLAAAPGALTRLGAATFVGTAVGLNRELRGKPAGVRTHALVSLGAALVTLVSVYVSERGGVADGDAVSRAVQGIVAGVGFIGGGVILKTGHAGQVRNLTTAASVWLAACLGIACGAGHLALAGIALAFTLLILLLGGPFEDAVRRVVPPRRRRRRDSTRADEPADAEREES
jgi:putative Mg2+ transporter-C (MgtC) family protein